MDHDLISKLRLSESELARFSALDEVTTPDEAKAIANSAADTHAKLLWYYGFLSDKGFVQYAGYLEDYRFLFLLGLKKTYSAGRLGSEYFATFKSQVTDKWKEEPWEANKGYIASFLNDSRGHQLKNENDEIRKYFDELPFSMNKIKQRIDDKEVMKELGPTLKIAIDATTKVNNFGTSWNGFVQDAELIRDKTEIADDSKTKTYLTERVKILGDMSKTLSEAMAIYSKTLDDRGILDYPG